MHRFLLVAACLMMGSAGWATPVLLRLKAKKGEVLTYALKVTNEQAPLLDGTLKAPTTVVDLSAKLRLEVLEAGRTAFRIRGRILDVDFKMTMGTFTLALKDLPMLEGMKTQLERTAVTFELAKDGSIGKIEIPPLGISLGQTSYGKIPFDAQRLFEGFLKHAMSTLPKTAVTLGGTWSTTVPSVIVTTPPVIFKYQHRYEANENMKGMRCAKVRSQLTIPDTVVGEDPAVFTLGGEGEATTWFALREGRVVRAESVVRAKLEMAGVIANTVISTVTSVLELE